jgi:hypothetical protein
MQKGGFNIKPLKDSEFKYTVDPNRILWTKNVFPIADFLIEAVLNIPWKTYRFEGRCNIWYGADKEQTKNIVWGTINSSQDDLEILQIPATITATPQSSPYYFFGGCVYEILDRLYGKEPGVPKLRPLVDPTGDLDIYLRLPSITKFSPINKTSSKPLESDFILSYAFEEKPPEVVNNPNTVTRNTYQNRPGRPRNTKDCAAEDSLHTSKDTRTYNALIESYTSWVMEQLAKNLLKYKGSGTLWNSLFGNTIPFSIDEDTEGMFADKIICIDNLKIVRCFLPYMEKIKIQLIAKFQGMDRSDHICEFLLPMSNIIERDLFMQYGNNREADQIQKGIPFSAFHELVQGNESGASNRLPLLNTTIRHKFYNHIMRMVYLNHFFEAKLNNINERNPSKLNFGRFLYATTMVQLNDYCLFILEQYFNNEYFFAMDYQMIDKLNPNTLQKLRNAPNVPQKKAELLQNLIGNFPKFMMEKKYGSYFFTGGTT